MQSRSKFVTRNWVPLMESSLVLTYRLQIMQFQNSIRVANVRVFHPKIGLFIIKDFIKYCVLHTCICCGDLNELCWNIKLCKCLEIFSWWLLTLDDLKKNSDKCKYFNCDCKQNTHTHTHIFYVSLIVHLSIILDNDQLDTHLLYFIIRLL